MKTAIVILNWNTRDFLEKYLPPLIDSIKGQDAEVIVADNASTDGSRELMKTKFPSIRLILFDENKGFTGGYNAAFELIDSEYFVLINSDIEVTSDWLEPLVEWMDDNPSCAACAPKLRSHIDRDKFEYAGAAGGYLDGWGYPFCRGRVLSMTEVDKGQYDTEGYVLWASGACLMVRSAVYREINGLDSRFFAHMEEIDLCWRMQLSGYKVNIVTDSVVYHIGGGTLPPSSPFKLYLNFRNNLLMLNNNLALTCALYMYYEGLDGDDAAKEGVKIAKRKMRQRIFLDKCSAFVYAFTFQFAKFKAVRDAHRDYKKLAKENSQKDIEVYLDKLGNSAEVKGIYPRWIIWDSLLYGKRIFEKVNNYFIKTYTCDPMDCDCN